MKKTHGGYIPVVGLLYDDVSMSYHLDVYGDVNNY